MTPFVPDTCMHVSDGENGGTEVLVLVEENMDNDRNTDLIMADAPLTPTESAEPVLDLIPASGNPGSSSDQRGETMEPSHGESR